AIRWSTGRNLLSPPSAGNIATIRVREPRKANWRRQSNIAGGVGPTHESIKPERCSPPPPPHVRRAAITSAARISKPEQGRPASLMTPQEFIRKWKPVALTERSAAQQHFLDLCRLFDHPTPVEDDPVGDHFTFEKGAPKTG